MRHQGGPWAFMVPWWIWGLALAGVLFTLASLLVFADRFIGW